MNVISIKDYAKQNNISYEAVRQQVVRYKKELEGHLIKDGRQQFLDEEAVSFLDAKRQKNPVAIIQMDKDERIENLERENKNLLIKIAEQAEELRTADKALAEVNVLLLNAAKDKERVEVLEAQNDNLSTENKNLKETLEEQEKTLKTANLKLEKHLNEERRYVEDLEAWANLPWFKRLRTSKPARKENDM